MVNHCPVCSGGHLSVFLLRHRVPVHQNLIVPDQVSARTVPLGELDMTVCQDCGFVFNQAFNPAKLLYGEHYDNSQTCSDFFDGYLEGLVQEMVENQGVRFANVVEVGCGKGQFLRKLVSYPGSGNRGFGFDPSYVGPDSDLDGRLTFRRSYYDDSCFNVPSDVVVCRHVIEHVPAPLDLLCLVRAALKRSPNARVFFETPCVEWILRNRVVWDFFYEHCSLFSAASLRFAFERAGFLVDQIERTFGGQYLWLRGRVSADGSAVPCHSGQDIEALARDYHADEQALRAKLLSQLKDLKRRGKVALWGAGAKGVTLANLVDAECELLDCIVDINPNKQGCFIPGSGHPIVAPYELQIRDVRSVILMNPNYRDENERLIAGIGLNIDLIDWTN